MTLFSVVIPTHNRADRIADAVESVLAQTEPDWELIVVDDGSTDATAAVLVPFGERLVVLRQDNAGPASARNLGIRHARGRYIVFLDSDDLLPPWALATYKRIIAAEAPALVLSRAFKFADDAALAALAPAALASRSYPDYLAAAAERHPVSVAAAVRRDLVLETGGFEAQLFHLEEQELFLRLGTAPGFVFVDAPALYAYRQSPGTLRSGTLALYRSVRFMLSQEARGRYPGGRARRRERRLIQARLIRFAVARCFEAGETARGYGLALLGLPRLIAAGRRRKLLRLLTKPLRPRQTAPATASG